MRVLVTGASGFVAAPLVARLVEEGHSVAVLPSAQFRAGRLAGLPYEAVAKPEQARAEVVYHLASTPWVPEVDDRDHARVIVGGTASLLERLESGAAPAPRRLVMTGSGAEYGSGLGWGEEDRLCPDSVFGALKGAAWALARASRIPAVLLRLFTPYGPGEGAARLIPSAAAAAVSGETLRLRSTGEQTRDYVHVLDVVEALVTAGARAGLEPGTAINICSGVERRALDVARQIFRLAGRAGRDVTGGEERPMALLDSSGNPRRAWELLGWRAGRNWEGGLREAIQEASKKDKGER